MRTALLAPVLLVQAAWVVARAARLPEAAGPREGHVGQGAPLRLLILGDSSAAGVGAASQDAALAGQLCADLARDHRVDWRLVARSGATVASARAMAVEIEGPFDAAVTCLGVNDVKNGVRRAVWREGYGALMDDLKGRLGVGRLVMSGLPPMGHFPLLPRPLRDVLGGRAEVFDADLQEIAARAGAVHLPLDFTDRQAEMAPDGFHPGPAIYTEWAARVAQALRAA